MNIGSRSHASLSLTSSLTWSTTMHRSRSRLNRRRENVHEPSPSVPKAEFHIPVPLKLFSFSLSSLCRRSGAPYLTAGLVVYSFHPCTEFVVTCVCEDYLISFSFNAAFLRRHSNCCPVARHCLCCSERFVLTMSGDKDFRFSSRTASAVILSVKEKRKETKSSRF